MKVNTATIHYKLRTQKVLSDGTSPIMLVVQWNGRKEKSTGLHCTVSQWDKKNECFKRNMPNYVALNKILNDRKSEVIERKLDFEYHQQPYTASMLLEDKKPELKPNTLDFETLQKQMAIDKDYSQKRKDFGVTAFNTLSKYMEKDHIILYEITNDVMIGYMKYLKSNNYKESSILSYSAYIYSLMKYAINMELMDANYFPLRSLEWQKNNINVIVKHRALDEKQISKLEYTFVDKYISNRFSDKGAQIFHYGLTHTYSECFAYAMFLMSYKCFGLAPVDLIKLKKENITEVEIKAVRYFKIETERSKTKKKVEVYIACNGYMKDIFDFMLNNVKTDYFLPILNDNKYDDERKIVRRISKVLVQVNRNLEKICNELDIHKFTMYAARHSFGSIMVHNGKDIGIIAQAMGRSITNIETYIKNLNKEDELADITNIL